MDDEEKAMITLTAIFIIACAFIAGLYMGSQMSKTKTITNTRTQYIHDRALTEEVNQLREEVKQINNPSDYIECDPDWDFDCPENGKRKREWYE